MSTGHSFSQPALIPWQALMAFGFGHLGLASEHFWSMTLREISAAADFGSLDRGVTEVPSRNTLEKLFRSYPDAE